MDDKTNGVVDRMAEQINEKQLYQVGHDLRFRTLLDLGFTDFEIALYVEDARQLAASIRRRAL